MTCSLVSSEEGRSRSPTTGRYGSCVSGDGVVYRWVLGSWVVPVLEL